MYEVLYIGKKKMAQRMFSELFKCAGWRLASMCSLSLGRIPLVLLPVSILRALCEEFWWPWSRAGLCVRNSGGPGLDLALCEEFWWPRPGLCEEFWVRIRFWATPLPKPSVCASGTPCCSCWRTWLLFLCSAL